MQPNAAIPTFRLPPGISLAQASPWHTAEVTLESPALDVMTDLTQVKAATIRPDATLEQAEQTMIYQGVRMLFVVSDMPELEGLITSTDLRGERQMRLVHARQLRFDEMRVADVMTELGVARCDRVRAHAQRHRRQHDRHAQARGPQPPAGGAGGHVAARRCACAASSRARRSSASSAPSSTSPRSRATSPRSNARWSEPRPAAPPSVLGLVEREAVERAVGSRRPTMPRRSESARPRRSACRRPCRPSARPAR